MDTPKHNEFSSLRQRAKSALNKGELKINKLSVNNLKNTEKLLEEFRIYQAELEIQNEELKRAQQQAEQAFNQTRILFQSLPLVGLVLDYRGIINDANDEAIRLFGFSRHFKQFKYSLYRFIHEEDKSFFTKLLLNHTHHSQVLRGIKIHNAHNELVVMDGHFIHLSLDYHANHYSLLLLIDRSAEAAYEKNKLLLQAMIDNSPALMMAFDSKGHCLLANKALFDATGKTEEKILGHSRTVWLNSDKTQELEQKDREVFTSGHSSLDEESFSFYDNEKHYYLDNRFPLRDQNGRIFGVGVVKTDISEIVATKNHLQAVLEAMPDLLFELDEEGYIHDFRNNQLELFPISREQAIGRRVFDLLPQEAGIVYMQALQEALFKGKSIGQQFLLTSPSGQYWFELSVSLKSMQEEALKKHFIVLSRNITERKLAELSMKEAELAITANQAKSEFLSQMSHELRTPLNAVLGFAQLLQEDELTEDQLDNVEEILNAGQHLLDLINDILDLSKIEARKLDINLEEIIFNELISECLTLSQPLAIKNNITLHYDKNCSEDNILLADKLRLKQILLNLISNAIKYNRPSGKVTICCETSSLKRLKVSITDTGYGLKLEEQQKLFQPFERLGAKNSTIEGTGIGLCICKKLIEAMDGNIGVDSVINEGSCFWVEIPLV